jgi:hypothetical protein
MVGIHYVFGIDGILELQGIGVGGVGRDRNADPLWDVALAIGVLQTTVDQTNIGVVQVRLDPLWLNKQVVTRVPLLHRHRHPNSDPTARWEVS